MDGYDSSRLIKRLEQVSNTLEETNRILRAIADAVVPKPGTIGYDRLNAARQAGEQDCPF